jgi:hypothetical protein
MLRQHVARRDGQVCRTPSRGSKGDMPDPEVAEGGSFRGMGVDGEQGRNATGAVISPILANIYLHYALDLWVEAWRRNVAHGDMIVVRYADDAVLRFERKEEAEQFLRKVREQLARFGLELYPEKTRLIKFGRNVGSNRERRGEGKPETFDFLGFTHMCGKNGKTGYFVVRHKTMKKRMRAKLRAIKAELIPTALLRGACSGQSTGKRFRLPAHRIELQVESPLSKAE